MSTARRFPASDHEINPPVPQTPHAPTEEVGPGYRRTSFTHPQDFLLIQLPVFVGTVYALLAYGSGANPLNVFYVILWLAVAIAGALTLLWGISKLDKWDEWIASIDRHKSHARQLKDERQW